MANLFTKIMLPTIIVANTFLSGCFPMYSIALSGEISRTREQMMKLKQKDIVRCIPEDNSNRPNYTINPNDSKTRFSLHNIEATDLNTGELITFPYKIYNCEEVACSIDSKGKYTSQD